MDDKLKAVLEKIAKLRALAANAGTQGEAEAAAAQAAALIAKYQIDEAQVEAADPARAEEIEESEPLWSENGPRKAWKGHLASGLAELHGCAVVRHIRGSNSTHKIAGRASDVAIVRYLFAWLHLEIARLADRERGRAAKGAFRLGAVAGVLRAMRAARQAETGASVAGSTVALAVVDRAEASHGLFERAAAAEGRKIGTSRAPTFSDAGAAQRGLRAGGNLAPKQALTAPDGTPLLGAGRV